jgi:DNA (cytosine-5)-methyltransferase 1
MKKINVVSLFSGCGGADLGLLGGFSYLAKKYKKLNYNIIHASDINDRAVSTYNLNFKHKSIVANITNIDFRNLECDLVIGGFPCQPFSTVNPKKQPHLKESQLFWEMARVIKTVKPRVIIAENVKGFYRLKNGFYFDLACKEFKRLGYNIYHSLLNSSHYGVPQKRERIIIVGIHSSIKKEFVFPPATHGDSKIPIVPLSSVIKSLVPDDPKYYFSQRAVEGVKKAKPNMKRALAQDLNQPCLTITSHLAKVSLNSRDPVLLVNKEKEIYRRFTPNEAALIQSFPNNFNFFGNDSDAYRQIGNAVPPVLMWHIANQLQQTILSNIK